jgi:hypothetical protein
LAQKDIRGVLEEQVERQFSNLPQDQQGGRYFQQQGNKIIQE